MSDNVRHLRTARDNLHKLEDRGIVENNLTMEQITAIRIAEFAIDEICSTDVKLVKREQRIKELCEQMKTLQENCDVEDAHAKADDILCEALKQVGYDELVNLYEKIEKWYS